MSPHPEQLAAPVLPHCGDSHGNIRWKVGVECAASHPDRIADGLTNSGAYNSPKHRNLPTGVQKVTSIEGVTEYAFPNGLHVLLFPDNSKPKITVNVVYLVGSRNEAMARPAWRTCWST
jgi:hypothetical protein